MAANDLTTLANVKEWLGLTDPGQTTDDAVLTRLITATSGFIRTWCSRDFVSQSYTDVLDGNGAARLPLPNFPITAVASLAIDGVTVPASPGFPQPGFAFRPTMLLLAGTRFTRGVANVTVSYTAGYAVIPAELEQACIELIAFRYREKDRVGMASKVMAGETTSFVIKDAPPSVTTLLSQFKKVVPV